MTLDTLTDEELNAEVARELGYDRDHFSSRWSTDIAAAWELVTGDQFEVSIINSDDGWIATLTDRPSYADAVRSVWRGNSFSAPRAICIAWLRASGRK